MTTLDKIIKILDGIDDASAEADNDPDIHVLHVGVVPGLVKALRRALPSRPGRRPRDCARLREILSLLKSEGE